ncbi:hypothetical protein IGL98_001953 [Enterococcus sp. DIV0840]
MGTKVDTKADLKATLTLGESEFSSPVKPVDGKDFKPETLKTNIKLTSEPQTLIEAKPDQRKILMKNTNQPLLGLFQLHQQRLQRTIKKINLTGHCSNRNILSLQ